MNTTPSPDDLNLAAEWLEAYEGVEAGSEDQAACHRVAAWLKEQADAKELRDAARAVGVPVAKARAALAKAANQ